MNELRQSIHNAILAFPGGYDAVAVAIGVKSGSYLRQKVLRHKGASLDIDEFQVLVDVLDTDAPMRDLAACLGGIFYRVLGPADVENTDVVVKLGAISGALSALVDEFQLSLANDGVIDAAERARLVARALALGGRAQEFVALVVRVYGSADALRHQRDDWEAGQAIRVGGEVGLV